MWMIGYRCEKCGLMDWDMMEQEPAKAKEYMAEALEDQGWKKQENGEYRCLICSLAPEDNSSTLEIEVVK